MSRLQVIGYIVDHNTPFKVQPVSQLWATHLQALRALVSLAVATHASALHQETINDRTICIKAKLSAQQITALQQAIADSWEKFTMKEHPKLPAGLLYTLPEFRVKLPRT